MKLERMHFAIRFSQKGFVEPRISVRVRVEAEGVLKELPLLVVEGASSNLFVRDRLASLSLE